MTVSRSDDGCLVVALTERDAREILSRLDPFSFPPAAVTEFCDALTAFVPDARVSGREVSS